MFTDLDTSTVDPEHAAIFAVEFLAWWFMAGRVYYGRHARERDDGLRLFAEDAVVLVGGWRAARRLLRSEAAFTCSGWSGLPDNPQSTNAVDPQAQPSGTPGPRA